MKSALHYNRVTTLITLVIATLIFAGNYFLHSSSLLRSELGLLPKPIDSLYMWIGAQNRQFTNAEIGQIGNRTNLVIIAPFHNGGKIAGIYADLQRLKEKNDQLQVMAYVNMTTVNPAMEQEMRAAGFQDTWYLRAEKGALQGTVMQLSPGKNSVKYIDIANPDYQDWLMDFIQTKRYDTGLYDGVVFDSMNSKGVAVGFERDGYWQGREYWQQHLSDETIDALDASLVTILERAKELSKDHKVGFNGFSPKEFREGTDHSNEPFYHLANFMLDEEFCAFNDAAGNTVYAPDDEILADLALMRDVRGTDKLFQVNAVNDANPSLADPVENYCYGLFLAGYYPGSLHSGGRYKVATTLEYWPRGITFDYGEPLGEFVYDEQKKVIRREYERGFVLSNISTTPKTVPAPTTGWIAGHLLNGTQSVGYDAGQGIQLAPRSSYFLIRSPVRPAAGLPPE